MGRITLILGGARSGKSTYALKLAKKQGQKVAFIATALPFDSEMKKRIKLHQEKRPCHFKTFEESADLSSLLERECSVFDVVIIDCLTLFISNLIYKGLKDDSIEQKIDETLRILIRMKCRTIIVSNEVGLGIVPRSKLGRRFRDLAGKINQKVAQKAQGVFFMVSGLPLKIKGGTRG